MKIKILMIAALAVALLCACAYAEGGLKIVCTDFPCYDFARQVAGEGAEVTMLLKPGVEAHSYEPTPSDIVAIGEANLFVYIGGESDAWADSILESFDGPDAPVCVRMMDCVDGLIEEDGDEGHHHGETEYDEHIWTSPRNAARMVLALGEAMGGVDPDNAETYAANAEAYAAQIDDIDAEIRAIVEGGVRRELVFADRFPFIYFVREYGLDYLAAFPSCTADTEPSAQTVMALIRRVEDAGIPVVYTIEMSTQSIARTISEETGAEVCVFQSMQTVSQADFDAGATYVSIMWENVGALRKGLN